MTGEAGGRRGGDRVSTFRSILLFTTATNMATQTDTHCGRRSRIKRSYCCHTLPHQSSWETLPRTPVASQAPHFSWLRVFPAGCFSWNLRAHSNFFARKKRSNLSPHPPLPSIPLRQRQETFCPSTATYLITSSRTGSWLHSQTQDKV